VCAPYRQGPTVSQRMPIYSKTPSLDRSAFRWIEVTYRPEYLASDFNPPRDDGLPQRDLLFELDIDTGQPVPLKDRKKYNPITDNVFRILLAGTPYFALKRVLPIYANTEVKSEDYAPGPYEHLVRRTGERLAGYQRVEIERPLLRVSDSEIFIADAKGAPLTSVMECSMLGTRVNPSCTLYEETESFEVKVGGFRRNQLDKIESIKGHARRFIACLTWKGD
jgi:hypothetical protein